MIKNQLVHFSYTFAKFTNPTFVKINLIIKPTSEELVKWCEEVSSEYRKELYSKELIDLENYNNNLKIDFNEEDEKGFKSALISSSYPNPQEWGWTRNHQLLEKLEKFKAYRYHEYCEVNPVVMGCIELLKTLQKDSNDSNCSWDCMLERTILALDLHWD